MPTLPHRPQVIECLERIYSLLFPEHFPEAELRRAELPSELDFQSHTEPSDQPTPLNEETEKKLRPQIALALSGLKADPTTLTQKFFKTLPLIRERLLKDAQAAFNQDPAAYSMDEVILSYPGFKALMTYRIAHELYELQIPLIPRMMSEHAHSITGCDIHPGAQIGESLFIDHGTGVVIGQTSVIGNRVTLFQGVTLGALAMKAKEESKKRHPTIEDDVILYSHATILGGNTTIGQGSIIGGSSWITQSVPPHTKVICAKPQMVLESTKQTVEYIPNWDI
ncbi:MAG: serine acetyltransferase [Deltaproteobacteria bacterium]|nr:serine acetyltransferase [Deltaproteobacteria bacterium]